MHSFWRLCLCSFSLTFQYWLFLISRKPPAPSLDLSIVICLWVTKKLKRFGGKELNGHKLSLEASSYTVFFFCCFSPFLWNVAKKQIQIMHESQMWLLCGGWIFSGTRRKWGGHLKALEVVWMRPDRGLSWTRECPQVFRFHVHPLQNVSKFARHFISLKQD